MQGSQEMTCLEAERQGSCLSGGGDRRRGRTGGSKNMHGLRSWSFFLSKQGIESWDSILNELGTETQIRVWWFPVHLSAKTQ